MAAIAMNVSRRAHLVHQAAEERVRRHHEAQRRHSQSGDLPPVTPSGQLTTTAGGNGTTSPSGDSPMKHRHTSMLANLRKGKRSRSQKNFASILKSLAETLEQASKKLPELEQWHREFSNNSRSTDALQAITAESLQLGIEVDLDAIPIERSPGDEADEKAVVLEVLDAGMLPPKDPSFELLPLQRLLSPPQPECSVTDSRHPSALSTEIEMVGVEYGSEMPETKSDKREATTSFASCVDVVPSGNEGDKLTIAIPLGVSSSDQSNDACNTWSSCGSADQDESQFLRLRQVWHEVDLLDIIKYEKELASSDLAVRRSSSKISPAMSEVKKHGFFPWRRSSAPGQTDCSAVQPTQQQRMQSLPSLASEASIANLPWQTPQQHRRGRLLSWVCHPQGGQRLFWDFMSIMLIAYDVITLPMYAFSFRDTPRNQVVEWLCTVFWTLDILMSFRTGYYVGHRLEMDPSKIARHYSRTWLLIDLCIVVPEWIARTVDWVVEGLNAARVGRFSRFVRFVRLIRIIKMGYLSDKIEEYLGNNFMLLGFSLMKMSLVLCVSVHILTCIWYGVGASDFGRWVDEEQMANKSLLEKYLTAARWTLAQINGRTDQVPGRTDTEQGYTIFCALFTVLFMSIFVSTLTTRMMELQRLMDEETRYTKMLINYLDHKKVSFSVSYLARMYVRNQKRMQSEQEMEMVLMKILPKSLKADLLYEVRSPTLSYHSFFLDLKGDFHKVLRILCADAVHMVQATAAQIIFEKEEELENMYIIERGDLRYAEDVRLTHHVAKLKDREQNRSRIFRVKRAKTTFFDGISQAPPLPGSTSSSACDGVAASIPGKHVSVEGTVLAEGALWVEWRSRGELIAVSMSMLMAVNAPAFFRIVSSFKEVQCRASRYARLFQWKLGQQPAEEVTDLDILDVQTLPTAEQRASMFARMMRNHA